MKKLLTQLTIPFLLSSCTDYKNKPVYQVKVGEEIEIYYNTNSCCYYFLDEKELQYVKKIREESKEGFKIISCDGCTTTTGYVFKGIKIGVDTIRLKKMYGGDSIGSKPILEEIYIVKVK